jgi:MFS family permease
MLDRNAAHGAAIMGIVFAATALAVGTAQYAFGLFIEPLEQTFGWTRTQISASLSFAAVGGLAAPFIGRAMDRFGARPILVGSLLIAGVGFVARPLMSELWHWYALSFLQFIAFSGMTILPTGRLVSAWYPHARGRMLGIAAMGNNFGGLTIPASVATILAFATWRESFVAIGVCCFVVALLAWVVIRERPPSTSPGKNTDRSRNAITAPTGATARQALGMRVFYAILAVITLGYFTYSTVLTHALAHLLNKGMSTAAASFALSMLAVGGLGGKLLFGALCDRYGARVATTINLSGQAVFAMLLATLETHTALTLSMPAFGLFMGGFGVASTMLVQDSFGMRHFGSIMGLMSASTVVAFGIGPVIAGLSYDYTGSYSLSFMVVSGLFLLAVLILLLVRMPGRYGSA